MKHRVVAGMKLEIVVSSETMKVLREIDETIDYDVPMRRTYLFEEIMRKHGHYDDNTRNRMLCPIGEILYKDFHGSVTLKEYF